MIRAIEADEASAPNKLSSQARGSLCTPPVQTYFPQDPIVEGGHDECAVDISGIGNDSSVGNRGGNSQVLRDFEGFVASLDRDRDCATLAKLRHKYEIMVGDNGGLAEGDLKFETGRSGVR
jgi:hypothetical protein